MKLHACVLFLVLTGCLVPPSMISAQPSDCDLNWEVINDTAPRVAATSVVFDGSKFLIFGQGSVMTSDDGESWSFERPVALGDSGGSVITGNGRILYTSRGMISLDGRHWESTVTTPVVYPSSVGYAGRYFFGLGYGSIILSVDCIHWVTSPASIPNLAVVTCVASDSGSAKYVAGLTNGMIGTSPDAVNWTWNSAPLSGIVGNIAWGNGHWVALGSSSSGSTLLESDDGESWQVVPSLVNYGYLLRFLGGRFFVVGDGLMSSSDGVNWTAMPLWVQDRVAEMAYGAGRYVAVTAGRGDVWVSLDGQSWHLPGSGACLPNFSHAYQLGDPPAYFAIDTESLTGRGRIWKSQDFSSWTQVGTAPEGLTAMTYGNGRFVAVGQDSLVMSSDDGISWDVVREALDSTVQPIAVCYGGGHYVSLGQGLIGLWSQDGQSWTEFSLPVSYVHFSSNSPIAYGAGRFVVATGYGQLLSSVDGLSWTPVWGSDTDRPLGVLYGDAGFISGPIFIQGKPGCLVSKDGLQWEQSDPFDAWFFYLWYVNHRYIVVGPDMWFSDDGHSWSLQPYSMPFTVNTYVRDLLGDGERLLGFGSAGWHCTIGVAGKDCVPSVTGLSKSWGFYSGGDSVTITGSHLSGATSVLFGAVPATSFSIESDTAISVVTPRHYWVPVQVTIDSPSGQSYPTPHSGFFFSATENDPVANDYFGMTSVTWAGSRSSLTIKGEALQPGCTIRINGLPVPKISMKRVAGGQYLAVVSGGAALKAMLPKGRYVVITLDNPGQPLMTAISLVARGKPSIGASSRSPIP